MNIFIGAVKMLFCTWQLTSDNLTIILLLYILKQFKTLISVLPIIIICLMLIVIKVIFYKMYVFV